MNKHQSPIDSSAPSSDEQHIRSVFLFSIREVVDQVWGDYLKAVDGELQSSGALTGFDDLDRMIGGLAPGLHLLASRPSMGKTTFMLNIVEHMSVENKLPCLIFSSDSTSYELTRCMVFSRARQPARMTYTYLRYPKITDQNQIRKAASEVADAPLFIEDSFDQTIESLQRIAARYKEDENIGFIAIDHLHLLRSVLTRADTSREREIVEIVAKIRGLARELNIPILLITELTRKPEYRRGNPAGMPRLSDMRYFKLIEGFATTISLLYRPEYYAETEDEREAHKNQAQLMVCKNPRGDNGSIDFRFDADIRRFEEGELEWI